MFKKQTLWALGCTACVMTVSPLQAQDADTLADQSLARMTQQEKLALLHGKMLMMTAAAQRPQGVAIGGGYVEGIPRLGIPPLVETDASLGVANLMNQRKGDTATALPSGLALASTWNPALIRKAGQMIGSEARAKGFNVMLAGGVNLVRDPRGGRNFEYLGEDPLLAGTLAGAQINGIQSNHIISTIKHFALNNQETGRSSASVKMGQAAMRESDLLAFEIAIERGRPGSVMCAYNQVNGVFSCENQFLLTDVLRRDWGYKGFVMSDWGAVHSLTSLSAGLDQQSGEQIDSKRYFSVELEKELASGTVSPALVDRAARRILYAIHAHGLTGFNPLERSPIDYEADAKVAQAAAAEGIVLLRNEGHLLPLAKSVRHIVLIGGHGDIGVLSGGGSSEVIPTGGVKLKERGGTGPAASFAERIYGAATPLEGLKAAFPQAEIMYLDGKDAKAAAEAAGKADLAIVLVEKFSTEAEDNKDMTLGNGQDDLIAAVSSANQKTIVVLETGNPVLMPWLEKVPAILALWYPGQRGAYALGQVLSGAVNPSGHLPVTFPAALDQLPNPVLPGSDLPAPSQADRVTYGLNTNSPPFTITYPEGADVGYRWFDRKGREPLYAFGHGLSYTHFSYDHLIVTGGKSLTVTFRVTNSGKRSGADVPQAYVRLPGQALRLIGWAKPMLKPGESRTIRLTADPRLLASFDEKGNHWTVPSTAVEIFVGHSALDLPLKARKHIDGQSIKP